MKILVLAILCLAPAVARAEKYSLHDAGEFQPLGYGIEFYDRFGWRGYEVDFDFDLDLANLTLGRHSRLKLRIAKRGGGHWDYSCKTGGRRPLAANVNALYGQGISVVVDCGIESRAFAKALALDPKEVGAPRLVFQALVNNGRVLPGAQRGIFLNADGPGTAPELKPYVLGKEDPAGLAVVFQSRAPFPLKSHG